MPVDRNPFKPLLHFDPLTKPGRPIEFIDPRNKRLEDLERKAKKDKLENDELNKLRELKNSGKF